MPSTFAQKIQEHVAAGYSALWISTSEPNEVIREITTFTTTQNWRMLRWDASTGIENDQEYADPNHAVSSLSQLRDDRYSRTLLVMRHPARYLNDPITIASMLNAVARGKIEKTHVLILESSPEMPKELERIFAHIPHTLPDTEQLIRIAQEIAPTDNLPTEEQSLAIGRAAAGLNATEAENAYALSIVRHGHIALDTLWEQKTAALAKTGFLTLVREAQPFSQLGGLEGLKTFCLNALRPDAPEYAKARGILIAGIPGTGKTAFATALGQETKRPTLMLDYPALFQSHVGETENNLRFVLQVADAMAPCNLFVDEIDKVMGTGNGETDGQTSSRSNATLLNWLNNHTSDVYFIGAANEIWKLHHAFARSERFDSVYMVETPNTPERSLIWDIYRKMFRIPEDAVLPHDEGWTGAEIRSCCRLAANQGESLIRAAKRITPVATRAANDVNAIRQWADGVAIDARTGEKYIHPSRASSKTVEANSEAPRRLIG